MNTSDYEVTVEQEVAAIAVTRPHVVIVGAGASRAACPDGDMNGRPLPLMDTLVDELHLQELVPPGLSGVGSNFEELYSVLHERGDKRACAEIEARVREHFSGLELPNTPTIYDHLILSLRGTDVIASFNWDPLLIQAYMRNKAHVRSVPKVLFLHGNVAMAYCAMDRIAGLRGTSCRVCGMEMAASPLLFPVSQKDYASDPGIDRQWNVFRRALGGAFMLTIFGYRGPRTDAEALKVMSEAWGRPGTRELEQTVFITRPGADEGAISEHWGAFVLSHHYEVCGDFHDSWISNHPRRTGEAWLNQYLDAKFITNNPAPRAGEFVDLWEWFRRFEEAESARDGRKDAPPPARSQGRSQRRSP